MLDVTGPIRLDMRRATLLLGMALICGSLALVGCGDGMVTYDVTGTVTFGGEPVTEGTVSFEDSSTGFVDSAELGANGTYSISLPEGSYNIAIEPIMVEVGGGPDTEADVDYKQVDNIPDQFRVNNTSGLTAKVSSGETEHNFDMTR